MHSKLPAVILILLACVLCGCVGSASLHESEKDHLNIFDEVKQATVGAYIDCCGADAEFDGIVIRPSLIDAEGNDVFWGDESLSVSIEIWTTKLEGGSTEVRDQRVYAGTGYISGWMDRILIPFEDIDAKGKTYGWCYVTIHAPVGDFKAVNGYTPLIP